MGWVGDGCRGNGDPLSGQSGIHAEEVHSNDRTPMRNRRKSLCVRASDFIPTGNLCGAKCKRNLFKMHKALTTTERKRLLKRMSSMTSGVPLSIVFCFLQLGRRKVVNHCVLRQFQHIAPHCQSHLNIHDCMIVQVLRRLWRSALPPHHCC